MDSNAAANVSPCYSLIQYSGQAEQKIGPSTLYSIVFAMLFGCSKMNTDCWSVGGCKGATSLQCRETLRFGLESIVIIRQRPHYKPTTSSPRSYSILSVVGVKYLTFCGLYHALTSPEMVTRVSSDLAIRRNQLQAC